MSSQVQDGQVVASSFRDPSGFLFREQGELYRQVNRTYQDHYDRLMISGLYETLVRRKLLIPHQEVNQAAPRSDLAYRVIRPDPLDYISYPYEWCFSQLKDAAQATLRIQKLALEHGMTLKDSSAYNIQFHHGRPVLIDTLSFETYQPGQPWVAYRQFCQHFLAPLSLMAFVDVRLGQLLRVYIDGLPLDLTARLLPFSSKLRLPLLLHLHLHAGSQRRYAGTPANTSTDTSVGKPVGKPAAQSGKMTKAGMLGLIDNLESGIKGLRWSPKDSEWGDYYDIHNYSTSGLEFKERTIAAYLEQIQPQSVWDLGANTGKFSRLASSMGIPTIAYDIDPAAVEMNYQQCVSNKERNLLPLIADLTNPSPGIGWQNQERMSLLERGPVDAVLALALVHHLAISNNVPLGGVAEFFHRAGRWLVVEFVPKSDSQVQRLLSTRTDIFPDYNPQGFEKAFSDFFVIQDQQKIPESERSIYLMEAR